MTKNSFKEEQQCVQTSHIHRNYSYKRRESDYKYQKKVVFDKFEIEISPIDKHQTKISKKEVQTLFQIDNYRTLKTLESNKNYKLIPSGKANYLLADVNKFLNANLILNYKSNLRIKVDECGDEYDEEDEFYKASSSNFVENWITLGKAIEFLIGENQKSYNDTVYRRYQKQIQRASISKIIIGKSNVLYFKDDLKELKTKKTNRL